MTAHQIPASTPRPKALLALLVLVVLLMAGPALVAGISLLDPHVLDATQGLAQVSAWLSYATHAGPILVVPLVALVGRATEDS